MTASFDNQTHPIFRYDFLPRILGFFLDSPICLPLSANDPHLALTHVSQEWRTIALTKPSFWRNFVFLTRSFNNPDRQLSAFRSLVRRSGSTRLSFHFRTNIDQHMGNITNLRVEDLVFGAGRIRILDKIILPYLPRLRYLDCLVSREENSLLLVRMPEAALENIDITYVNACHLPPSMFVVHGRYTFRHSESSRASHQVVTKCHVANGFQPRGLKLPWDLMTKMDMGTTILSPNKILRILRLSSSTLTDGFFYIAFDVRSIDLRHQDTQPVEMTSLKKLRLRLVDTNYYPNFMLLFRIPALRDLWVEWADRHLPFEWDMSFYASWLSSTSNSLERLLMTDLPFYPAPGTFFHSRSLRPQTSYSRLESLLKVIPNIKSLCLPTSIDISSSVLANIATGNLLRHLDYLELATNVDPDVIFDTLSFRNLHAPSFGLSPITALNLTLPSIFLVMRNDIQVKVEDLHLTRGYMIQFRRPCSSCLTYCYFGN